MGRRSGGEGEMFVFCFIRAAKAASKLPISGDCRALRSSTGPPVFVRDCSPCLRVLVKGRGGEKTPARFLMDLFVHGPLMMQVSVMMAHNDGH